MCLQVAGVIERELTQGTIEHGLLELSITELRGELSASQMMSKDAQYRAEVYWRASRGVDTAINYGHSHLPVTWFC